MTIHYFDYSRPLHIGNQVAENDWETLRAHFVSIGTSHFVGKPTTSIILGRKGSGKSALRLHFERTNQTKAVSIQPSSEDLKGIYEYIVHHGNSPFAVEPIEALWEVTVLLNLVRLTRQHGRQIDHPDVPSALAYDLQAGERFGIGRTLALLREKFPTDRIRNTLIRGLRDHIDMTLRDGGQYYVLIDSVDDLLHNSFDTTHRNDLFATFLESLLNFCRNFGNIERNKLASRIYLQVFIPIDLYKWSIDRHADHLRQYKHIVRWTPDHLNEFATSRLMDNIRPSWRPNTKVDVWRHFFPEVVRFTRYNFSGEEYSADIPIDKALISMTLMRPRDLQDLVRQIDQQTKNSGRHFPTSDDIIAALQGYSIELYESVISEYSTVFPELADVLSRLAYNASVMPRDLIYDLVGRVVGHQEERIFKALQILYETGVIGVASSDREAGEEPLFSYAFENFESISRSPFYVVHRAFWHSLRVQTLSARPESP